MTDQDRSRRFREFLYVDRDRVRSLLAQLDGGVVEKVVERQSDRTANRFGGKLLGLEGSRERLDEGGIERTRTFDDMEFALFEEAAEISGLLADVPELHDPDAWENDSVRSALQPGQLVRASAPTQLLDPPHVREVMMRALSATEAYARFEEAVTPTPMPPTPPGARTHNKAKALEQWHEEIIDARIGSVLGISLTGAIAVGAMLEKLLGEAVTARVFPCGAQQGAFVLTGPLPDLAGNFRDDRTSLFAKFGWEPSDWTVVAQIATVPAKPALQQDATASAVTGPEQEAREDANTQNSSASPTLDGDFADGEPMAGSGPASPQDTGRAAMAQAAFEFLGTMAEAGLTDTPRYPSITISILGIYREVPQAGMPVAA